MAGELKVIYNNNIIRTSTADDTFTLNCNGKLMASDVTIQATDVDSLTVTYGGNTIATGSGTVTKILNCDGRYMSGDIGVAVTMNSAPSYPVKGDIINIDMNGDGTDEQYLVLKTNGSVVEVLSRAAYQNAIAGSRNNNTYASSNLDTNLNSTWYNTCSSTAKSAIVRKSFRQDSWYRSNAGNPDYIGVYGSSNTQYTISLGSGSYGSSITRYAYALRIQDIIDYLGVTSSMTADNTTLNTQNIQQMFYGTSGDVWLCSAEAGSTTNVVVVQRSSGNFSSSLRTSSKNIYPAFQIDLSKISWSFAGGA